MDANDVQLTTCDEVPDAVGAPEYKGFVSVTTANASYAEGDLKKAAAALGANWVVGVRNSVAIDAHQPNKYWLIGTAVYDGFPGQQY